jgi:hypothetical protein
MMDQRPCELAAGGASIREHPASTQLVRLEHDVGHVTSTCNDEARHVACCRSSA